MTRTHLAGLVVLLAVAGCASPPATKTADSCPHEGAPPVLRPDLPARFLSSPGHVIWPTDAGFAPGTLSVVIQPGQLLDRYGDAAGTFLSPKGTGYRERALPYVCQGYAYTTYRVIRPFPARVGVAAAWFAEPGGAVQVETADCVNQLRIADVLAIVPNSPEPACPAS